MKQRVAFVWLMLMGVVGTVGGAWQNRAIDGINVRLANEGVTTKGVVETRHTWSTGDSRPITSRYRKSPYRVRFSFTGPDGGEREQMISVPKAWYDTVEKGQEVGVLYVDGGREARVTDIPLEDQFVYRHRFPVWAFAFTIGLALVGSIGLVRSFRK